MRRINWLSLIAGLGLASISLFFSATGLVHLFAGAGISIALLAIAFEVAKVATTVHLVVSRFRALSAFLAVALVLMSAVSSVGIYGYLGRAYNEGRADAVEGAGAVTVLTDEVASLTEERDRLLGQIEAIPAEHSTNRLRVTAQIQPQIAAADSLLREKRAELSSLQRAQVGKENDIGELKYAAALFNISEEQLAMLVITVLAFLLDPLAILLVATSGIKGQREVVEKPVADLRPLTQPEVPQIELVPVDKEEEVVAGGHSAALTKVLSKVRNGSSPTVQGNRHSFRRDLIQPG